jgi:acetyl-CoA carboxylase alpha subunit
MAKALKQRLISVLKKMRGHTIDELLEKRYQKLMRYGRN